MAQLHGPPISTVTGATLPPTAAAVAALLLELSTSPPSSTSSMSSLGVGSWTNDSLGGGASLGAFLLQTAAMQAAASAANSSAEPEAEERSAYSISQMILIALVAGFLSLVTVVGNFMVMISFKMDKQLQTITNYFLLSLAVADFAIGLISMPLYTVYLLLDSWPFGPTMCDTWLSLDYLASNASVLNLLIISFDRYFSVTRPLTYRARRTTRRAIVMISSAWIISLILWPPWIYSWPYIEGQRTVEHNKCYIQFLETNLYITFGTAIAAFYIPVTVMCVLYWQIWRETEKRQKDLTNLQAVNKDNSKRSTSSDEAAAVASEPDEPPAPLAVAAPPAPPSAATSSSSSAAALRRARTDSAGVPDMRETTYVPTAMCMEGGAAARYQKVPGRTKRRALLETLCSVCLKTIDHEPPDFGLEEDSTSDAGHGSPGNTTPASVETPVQSSVSRCTSLTLRADTAVQLPCSLPCSRMSRSESAAAVPLAAALQAPLPCGTAPGERPNGVQGRPHTRAHSADSVYTILIRLPLEGARSADPPSIQMIAEEEQSPPRGSQASLQQQHQQQLSASAPCEPPTTLAVMPATTAANRRVSQAPPSMKLPLNAKLVPKQAVPKAVKKKKKKTQERKQDRKAAKTLSAILLAFIITWTPYNVMVLIKTLASCETECIPMELWHLVYYLCYINSTANPLCYALCNASFRRTYVRILTCKWHTKKRNPNRGYYN